MNIYTGGGADHQCINAVNGNLNCQRDIKDDYILSECSIQLSIVLARTCVSEEVTADFSISQSKFLQDFCANVPAIQIYTILCSFF